MSYFKAKMQQIPLWLWLDLRRRRRGGFRLGPGGHRPPKSCPGPPNFWLVP